MEPFRCSRYLWFLTYFMVGFPPIYLVFAAFVFELNSKGILSVSLSPLFYIASIFWIMTGVGIRRMRHWSWYTFGAAQFFITYLNALNLINYSESAFKSWAFALTVLLQLYVYLVVAREIRVPFLFPRIKWWESGIAGMHHLPVEILHSRAADGVSVGQMLDINTKGCFIKSPIDYQSFEKVKLKLNGYGHQVDIAAVIVWNAKSNVTHPKGIGLQFIEKDRNRRRKIRIISKRFEQEREKASEPLHLPT